MRQSRKVEMSTMAGAEGQDDHTLSLLVGAFHVIVAIDSA